MTKIQIKSMLVLSALLISSPAFAGITLEINARDDNALDLQAPFKPGETLNVNAQDCSEKSSIEITFKVTVTGELDGTMKLYEGQNCNNSSSECRAIKEIDIQGAQKTVYPKASLSSLVGDNVFKTNGSTKIWAGIDKEKSNGVWSNSVDINWDSEAPSTPTAVSAIPGANKAEVHWTVKENESDGGVTGDIEGFYILYWSGDEGSDSDTDSDTDGDSDVDTDTSDAGPDDAGVGIDPVKFPNVCAMSSTDDEPTPDGECPDGGFEAGGDYSPDEYGEESVPGADMTRATVLGLRNGYPYKFAVVAYDEYRNFSKISEIACTTPGNTHGFWDECVDSGCRGGKFCFVATAAFGSYDHPVVKKLRLFRDNFIERLPGGESLVGMYYAVGPKAAAIVGRNQVLKGAVKGSLTVIAAATMPLSSLGPLGTLGIGFIAMLGILIPISLIRRRQS